MEDEVHFILKCPFHDDLRNPIIQLANLQYPNFTEVTNLEQLTVIYQSEDLLKTKSSCLNIDVQQEVTNVTSYLPIRPKLSLLDFRWVLENCV